MSYIRLIRLVNNNSKDGKGEGRSVVPKMHSYGFKTVHFVVVGSSPLLPKGPLIVKEIMRLLLYIYRRQVLQLQDAPEGLNDIGEVSIRNLICLLFAWIFIFFCLMKGVKSSGKVSVLIQTQGLHVLLYIGDYQSAILG